MARMLAARNHNQSPMNKLLMLGVCGLFALRAAAAADDPTAHELHSAQCVAALEASADDLAAQVKAGHEEMRTPLLDRLKHGAAFIADSYIQGERDEGRAKEFLAAAREAQKALPKAELSARQLACAQEGADLLAKADFLSRAVVSRLAQKRMKKLLES